MTKPLSEPSVYKDVGRGIWRTNQLERRPIPETSGLAIYEIKVIEDDTVITVGDDKFVWEIPEDLAGATVVKVEAYISTAGGDTTEVQIRLSDPCDAGADILSTPITIDAGECNSKDAAAQPVVTPATNVAWGDHLHIDIDEDGDGAMGLGVIVVLAPSALASVVLEGATGAQGPPGGINNWTGEWDDSTNYVTDDAVSHNGSSYVAINNNTNVEPGVDAGWETDWMLLAAGTTGLFDAYALLRDEKAANTAGGTFTSGAWQTRVLNTETDPGGIVSIASNQFTLQAGTYFIRASSPAFMVNRNKAKLRNVTDSTDTIVGTSEYSSSSSDFADVRSVVTGRFTIAAAKTFEIQHRCATTKSGDGFGVESNFGVVEVYAEVEIWREI